MVAVMLLEALESIILSGLAFLHSVCSEKNAVKFPLPLRRSVFRIACHEKLVTPPHTSIPRKSSSSPQSDHPTASNKIPMVSHSTYPKVW